MQSMQVLKKWGSIQSSKVKFCVAWDLPLSPQLLCVGSHSWLLNFRWQTDEWNPPQPLNVRSDLPQIPVHYETLERGKGISWQGRTAEWVTEAKGEEREFRAQSNCLGGGCNNDTKKNQKKKISNKIKVALLFRGNSGGNYSQSCCR